MKSLVGLRAVVMAVVMLAGAAGLTGIARADEPAMAVAEVRMPRAEARIGNQELVLTYAPPVAKTYLLPATPATLTAYLQRYTDGTPTPGAQVEVTIDFIPGELAEISPGVYQSNDWQLPAGRSDIDMSVTIDGATQTVTIPFTVTATSGPRPRAPIAIPVVTVPGYVFAAAAAAIYAGVVLLFMARRRRRLQAAEASAASAHPVQAEGGHEVSLVRA